MSLTTSPAWLSDYRDRAERRFQAAGFPNLRTEGWRKTPVSAISRMPLQKPRLSSGGLSVEELEKLQPMKSSTGARLVFVSGVLDTASSRLGKFDALQCLPLSKALEAEHPAARDWLRAFPAGNDTDENAFSSLNGAGFSEGSLIVADRQGDTAQRDLVQVIHSAQAQAGAAIYPRTILIARAGSRVRLIEVFGGDGADAFLNAPVTEILAEEGAHVEYCRINRDPAPASHMGMVRVVQGAGSDFRMHSFSSGARLTRVEVHIKMLGDEAKAQVNGLAVLRDEQLADHHIRVRHLSDRAESSQKVHSVVSGRARSVFTGRVIVEKHTRGNNAQQSSRNLLLSNEANAYSEPQLEIHADEVKCSHGSATGRLEDEALFYLRSRGIPEADARSILVEAFARELLLEVGDEPVREHLLSLLAEVTRA